MNWRGLLSGDSAKERVVPATGFTALLTLVSAAAMAFLAVFAIALALAAEDLADRWEAELAGSATIRLSAPPDEVPSQLEAVLAALDQTPGILSARRLEPAEQAALLEPWFGADLPLDALDLPVLIDVRESREGPDLRGLRQRLAAEAPGAVYDTHSRWQLPLIEAADRLGLLGLMALLLMAGVMAVTIALATSAALAANGQIIDVLRLVGARDQWIRSAFVRRFTMRALFGAIAGTAVAMAAIALIPPAPDATMFRGVGLAGAEWLWPLLVPPAAALLAFGATRVAAGYRLKEVT